MSNRKIKIRAIDAHKKKRNAALDHYGRLYRQCRTFHSLEQCTAFYAPAERPLAEARAAIREHRELGKDGRFLARGMANAERLCDGYAERSRTNWRHA